MRRIIQGLERALRSHALTAGGDMETLFLYLTIGCAAGFSSGLLGIGGGLIVVPMLVMHYTMLGIADAVVLPLALGTSLASIVFTSLAGVHAHHRRGAVDWPVVRSMAPGLITGAMLGAALSAHVPTTALKIFFLAFAFIAATQMLLLRTPHGTAPLFAICGAIAGIASLAGTGGASLAVPFMTWCAVPVRRAIGTACAISLPIALASTAVYMITGSQHTGLPPHTVGFVHLTALAAITLGSVLAVPAGAALSHRMPVGLLKKCFALMLYAVSGKMLLAVM